MHTTQHTMQPLGYQQTRSLTVVNAVIDTDSFSSAKHKLKSPMNELYPTTGDPRDHTIRRGDVMVCKRRGPHWGLEQLPFVRSCLNGLTLENDDDDEPPEDLIDAFWEQYTKVGVSRKDIPVKLTGVAGAPQVDTEGVAVTNGMFTITNSGTERIEAGEAFEVYCLERRTRPRAQYQDGKRTRLNDDRMVLGLRPYDMTCRDVVRYLSKSPALFVALLNFMQAVYQIQFPDQMIPETVLQNLLEENETFRNALCNLINKLHKPVRDAWRTTVGVAQSSNAEGLRIDAMIHPAAMVRLELPDPTNPFPTVAPPTGRKTPMFGVKVMLQVKDKMDRMHANRNKFITNTNVGAIAIDALDKAGLKIVSPKARTLFGLIIYNFMIKAALKPTTPAEYPIDITADNQKYMDDLFVVLQKEYDAKFRPMTDNAQFKREYLRWNHGALFRALVGKKDLSTLKRINECIGDTI